MPEEPQKNSLRTGISTIIISILLIIILLLLGFRITSVQILGFGLEPPTLSMPTGKYACPFSGSDDESTIKNIINAESNSAINEDFDAIGLIYFPDAVINDHGTIWHNSLDHYKDTFANFDILDVNNTNIQIRFVSTESAIAY